MLSRSALVARIDPGDESCAMMPKWSADGEYQHLGLVARFLTVHGPVLRKPGQPRRALPGRFVQLAVDRRRLVDPRNLEAGRAGAGHRAGR